MPPADPAPLDYNQLAEQFDRFLPQIHPVGVALLARLPALAAGATVLDVACGTGEPGLTLARSAPEVRVQGVDQAEAMIRVAQHKAARDGHTNVEFAVMPMDALALPDASVDAVISRFGLLMFGDVPAAAGELARVLRPGAPFSLAVWDDPARNTLMSTLFAVLRRHLPPGHRSPLDALGAWAAEGRRQALLEQVGLAPVHSAMFAWDYRFASADEPWALVRSMDRFTGQAALAPEAQAEVRRELDLALAAYRQADGTWTIPHACRLIWGARDRSARGGAGSGA